MYWTPSNLITEQMPIMVTGHTEGVVKLIVPTLQPHTGLSIFFYTTHPSVSQGPLLYFTRGELTGILEWWRGWETSHSEKLGWRLSHVWAPSRCPSAAWATGSEQGSGISVGNVSSVGPHPSHFLFYIASGSLHSCGQDHLCFLLPIPDEPYPLSWGGGRSCQPLPPSHIILYDGIYHVLLPSESSFWILKNLVWKSDKRKQKRILTILSLSIWMFWPTGRRAQTYRKVQRAQRGTFQDSGSVHRLTTLHQRGLTVYLKTHFIRAVLQKENR